MYTVEPLLGQLYVARAIQGMERVLAMVRKEVFRVLLMQPIAFFDRHGAAELSNVLAVELDSIRQCIFGCVTLTRRHGISYRVNNPVHKTQVFIFGTLRPYKFHFFCDNCR